MRIATLIAVTTLAALSGCAETPTPAAPAAVPVAAAKPATPAPASATNPAATVPGGVSAELYAKAREQGYRSKVVKGRTLFCRNEAPIGSRLTKEACVSADELAESVRQAELVRDQMRRGNTCGTAACGGS